MKYNNYIISSILALTLSLQGCANQNDSNQCINLPDGEGKLNCLSHAVSGYGDVAEGVGIGAALGAIAGVASHGRGIGVYILAGGLIGGVAAYVNDKLKRVDGNVSMAADSVSEDIYMEKRNLEPFAEEVANLSSRQEQSAAQLNTIEKTLSAVAKKIDAYQQAINKLGSNAPSAVAASSAGDNLEDYNDLFKSAQRQFLLAQQHISDNAGRE